MINYKSWNAYNRLKPVAESAWRTARANPRAAGFGLAGGALFGLASSNEGRGPISNTLFWAPVGVAAGLAAVGAAPHLKLAAQNAQQMSSFLRRAPQNWKGLASQSAEVLGWVSEAKSAAKMNPGMGPMSTMYDEFIGSPANFLARPPKATNEQLVAKVYGFLRSNLSIGGEGPLTAAELHAASPNVPEWMKTAMSISYDLGSSKAQREGLRTEAAETFLVHNAGWDWKQIVGNIDSYGDNEKFRNNFLSGLNAKMAQYSKNWTGGLSATDIGNPATRKIADKEIDVLSQTVSRLEGQGQRRMARWVKLLKKTHGGDVRITGIINREISQNASEITGLRVMFGDIKDQMIMELDVPNAQGIIRHGRWGQNIHVPRNAVDIRSIKALYDGRISDKLKPRLMDPASFVLSNLIGFNKETGAERLEWLQRSYGRLTSWETQPYRSDRAGLESAMTLEAISRGKVPLFMKLRSQSAMVVLPTDPSGRPIESLFKEMGFAGGESNPLNFMGQVQGTEIPAWLSKWGLLTTASENQARNATFSQAFQLMELDPSIIVNPLSKPSLLERDVAKPYRLAFNENLSAAAIEEAKRVSWVPFASEKMRANADAYEQGFLMNLNPVFEGEANLMRKLVLERNKKVAYRLFKRAGIDKSNWRLLYKNLGTLSEINEGGIASATPRAIEMANSRLLEFDLINKDLLEPGKDWESLIGKQIGQQDYIGMDIHTGEMFGHTYSEKSQGRAIIREIQTRVDPDTLKTRILARIEERYPGQEAKIGTAASKSYMRNLDVESIPAIGQFLDYFRLNAGKNAKMYANQAVIPVFGNLLANPNAVTAFALQSTMYKYQNPMSTLFNNLLVKHMPAMTPLGQNMMMKMLRESGVDVQRIRETGQFQATAKGLDLTSGSMSPAERMKKAEAYYEGLMSGPNKQGLLRRVYTAMYNRPRDFFKKGSGPMSRMTAGTSRLRLALGKRKIGWANIQGFEMMTGQYAPAKIWDTLESNVPGQASITMHELQSLEQYGLHHTYAELLGRGKRSGELTTTGKFYAGLKEMGNAHGYIGPDALKNIGINSFNLGDVSPISKIDTNMGFMQTSKAPWRQLGQFEENFVIDLRVAHGQMDKAAAAVQEALGTTQVFVPGTKSDMWGVEYVSNLGNRTDTEGFVGPLERMLASVSRHYQNPLDKRHLINAKRYHQEYLSSISDTSKILYTGRGGSIKDASGLWATGRARFRPYRSIYKEALGEELASSVVGVSPEKWRELTSRAMRETGAKSVEELAAKGHAISRGGHIFLAGNSIRYPITDAGPVLFAMDKSLRKGGIGMEEAYRYIKNADFDGDSLIARVFMEKSSVNELVAALTDPNSIAFKKYHEALRISDIFGGATQDVRQIAETGTAESLYRNLIKRQKKFKYIGHPGIGDDASKYQDMMERMGKMWTSHIGRYSNLSKIMTFMTDLGDLGDTERMMRSRVGMELQQLSIDFGRAATAGGMKVVDPTALAQTIGQAWQLAGRSPASAAGGANELMRGVFEDLGFVDTFSKKILANSKNPVQAQKDIEMLTRLTQNWFSTLDQNGALVDFDRSVMATRGQFLDSLVKRGLRRDELHAALGEFIFDQRIRALGGENAWLPVPGGMPKAGEMLSEINAMTKSAVAGTARLLKTAWKAFRTTPEGRAAGSILVGAGVVAAGIGMLTSPAPMDAPEYPASKSAGAMMRSPDVGMAMSDGGAPLPGSRGGHVASSLAPESVPRYTRGVHMQHKRFYYDQSNRTPRTTSYAATTPEEANFQATESGADMQRGSGGGTSQVNVVNSPSARRYSRTEMQSRVRDDLYR